MSEKEIIEEAQEYVRHLTSTADVLTCFMGLPAQKLTIENLRISLEGLLELLGADPHSGYGTHSSEEEERKELVKKFHNQSS